jgi:hypothetical protein
LEEKQRGLVNLSYIREHYRQKSKRKMQKRRSNQRREEERKNSRLLFLVCRMLQEGVSFSPIVPNVHTPLFFGLVEKGECMHEFTAISIGWAHRFLGRIRMTTGRGIDSSFPGGGGVEATRAHGKTSRVAKSPFLSFFANRFFLIGCFRETGRSRIGVPPAEKGRKAGLSITHRICLAGLGRLPARNESETKMRGDDYRVLAALAWAGLVRTVGGPLPLMQVILAGRTPGGTPA